MMIQNTFFDGWSTLLRTFIVCLCAYPGMLIILRVSGNRTLSKLNAFDFVVTVALGSTLASVLMSSDVSISQGLLTFTLLVVFQYCVARLAVAKREAESIINGEPKILFSEGRYLKNAMRQARITEEEVRSSARKCRIGDMALVHSVILETDGTLSVITRDLAGNGSALKGVQPASESDRQ